MGNAVYYWIGWGDGDWRIERWFGECNSGEDTMLNHTWSEKGIYTTKASA